MNKKCLVKEVSVLLIIVLMLSSAGVLATNTGTQTATNIPSVSAVPMNDDSPIDGTNWIESYKIIPSDGTAGDYFGYSTSISGDYAIVGVPLDDEYGYWSGSAYIYKREGINWVEQKKLSSPGIKIEDRFGLSVSIDGDYAIVGAPGENIFFGAAYIYKREGTDWVQQAKLIAPGGPIEECWFGLSVSINGDTAIVGAPIGGFTSWTGSAYVYKREGTNWVQQAKLEDEKADTYFGGSVSVDGDYAVIGAYYDDEFGMWSGSAYIYKREGTNWIKQTKLLASDGADRDEFGYKVSISGDYAIIGAAQNDDNGDDSGSAYIFKRQGTNWIEETKLIASDGAEDDNFGLSVSIDGDYAIVSSPFDTDVKEYAGAAYIFKRDGTNWNEEIKLLASDGELGDGFGASVSIDDYYAIITAVVDDDNGENSGSAYIFRNVDADFAPTSPNINGPTNGNSGTLYDYTFMSTDPNGDNVCYFIDWGDGNQDTTCFYPSGEEVTFSHTWNKQGTYTIKAKAIDVYGAESEWGTLDVTMPKSYSYNQNSQQIQNSQSSQSTQQSATTSLPASTSVTTTTITTIATSQSTTSIPASIPASTTITATSTATTSKSTSLPTSK